MPHLPLRAAARALLALVCAGTVVLVAPGPASAAGPGVCAGVSTCRVVARVDVDGNGTRDPVALSRFGKNGGPNGSLVVRVKVGAHRIVKVRRKLTYWYGPVWQGSAVLDGRKGRELVVGHTAGCARTFCSACSRGGTADSSICAPRTVAWTGTSTGPGRSMPATSIRAGTPAGTLLRPGCRPLDAMTTTSSREPSTATSGPPVSWKRTHHTAYAYVNEETAYRWAGCASPAWPLLSRELSERPDVVRDRLSGSPGPATTQISGRTRPGGSVAGTRIRVLEEPLCCDKHYCCWPGATASRRSSPACR